MPTKQNEQTIIIDHVAIPLSAISGTLRRAYECAVNDVAGTPDGPKRNIRKAKMSDLATQALREAAATLALRISPRSHGAAGIYEARNRAA